MEPSRETPPPQRASPSTDGASAPSFGPDGAQAPSFGPDGAHAPSFGPDGARAPSFGNVGPHHWSRARAGENAEAIDYYQKRSKAPGVKSGGGARNFYCMSCDGVIDFDAAPAQCPHCGASLAESARRYFNWVELNDPAPSDFKALLPVFALAGIALVTMLVLLVWWLA